MAFQGWVGLTRDGVAGSATLRRLHKAKHRPTPWSRVYKHVEVHKVKQVLLTIAKGGKVTRAIHVSTAAPGHVTPSGHFRIIRKAAHVVGRSRSRCGSPTPATSTPGDAFHQYPSVPGYPASHGCIRIFDRDAIVVYQFATVGTRVAYR